jgi:hypothetical protein
MLCHDRCLHLHALSVACMCVHCYLLSCVLHADISFFVKQSVSELSLCQAAMDLGPSPDVLPNVVPMMAGVERAFDSYRMCAVPSRDALTEDVSFEVSGSSHHCDCVGVCLCVSQRQGCLAISITCFLPTGLMHVMGGVLKCSPDS